MHHSTICVTYFVDSSSSKRPRLEAIPAANLDADDPIDDDVSIYVSYTFPKQSSL